MTQLHQRNRHPKYRKKYKIRNWPSYERSLINRGDLTLWLSEDVIQSWNSDLDQRMGRPKLYSDLAIETALTLRLLFKLPLRQTEGFLKSIFRLMNVGLNVPDHTTLSRRNSTLKTKLKRIGNPRGRVDLVIDSTGLVIHGEGRWTRHKHGKRKRRGWRKLHIGVSNGLIVAHYLSEDRNTDGELAPHLIHQVGRIDSITADKAYDQRRVYEAANDQLKEGGQINIHPRANAVVSASDEAALRQRNQHVKSIDEDGVLPWKRTSGYYRQSEVENMFFRYKNLIGDELKARNENSRRVESIIACNILNQFRLLGSPQSKLVA